MAKRTRSFDRCTVTNCNGILSPPDRHPGKGVYQMCTTCGRETMVSKKGVKIVDGRDTEEDPTMRKLKQPKVSNEWDDFIYF